MFLASKFVCSLCCCWPSSGYGSASPELRVCADPNNLPYSNQQQQGFENALAQLVAHDMGMSVSYYWFPQRHRFFRNTLEPGVCDVVMEVPSRLDVAMHHPSLLPSTYVFVSRHDRDLRIRSFDDPRLRDLRIGVHDHRRSMTTSAPNSGAAEARDGTQSRRLQHFWQSLGRESGGGPDSRGRLREVDVALVWGPLGGYFAQQASEPLDVTPVMFRAFRSSNCHSHLTWPWAFAGRRALCESS